MQLKYMRSVINFVYFLEEQIEQTTQEIAARFKRRDFSKAAELFYVPQQYDYIANHLNDTGSHFYCVHKGDVLFLGDLLLVLEKDTKIQTENIKKKPEFTSNYWGRILANERLRDEVIECINLLIEAERERCS